ncbi:MAG: hypothetical protein PF450_11485 [Bacteroidales bacterium]|jgi:hypothetical protein|nr:hypothetical protein [Bacteroidales bacterium]
MPEEALEMASYLTFIIESATDFDSESGFDTGIPCINKPCKGIIHSSVLVEKDNEIYWWCPKCKEEGIITEWEGTQWDKSVI